MSSTKRILRQFSVITDGAMTGTSVITSKITNINFLDNIGFQIDFTGSPVGTFQVLVSANHLEDPEGNVLKAGTWVPTTLQYFNTGTGLQVVATSIPTSVGSPIYIDANQLSAPWIMCVYTNASGTGTLNVVVCGKEV